MAGFFLARRTAKQMTKPMKTQTNRGQAMREARRRFGLTQLDLAQRVGCTESLVTKIETGRATPEQSLKEAIARELNIATWEVGV
jgi:ribosome-binding protein aMBF1 (putative translation factor)